jgi:exonuclease SbcD
VKSTIKFIHLSDIHIGFETHGKIITEQGKTGRNTRLEDVLRSLDSVVDTAIKESVDLVLIAGDVFHRENPHPTEETEFAKRIIKLVREVEAKVVIVLGNHDYPVALGKSAAVEIFPALNIDGVFVARRPHVFSLLTKKGIKIQVACLPWAGRSTLLTKEEYKSLSPEDIRLEVEKKLIHIIRDLVKKIDSLSPAVFLGHVALRDAERSGTEITTLLMSDPTVPRAELAKPVLNYVALGHIHKFQNLNENSNPPIVYSGSIERIDFTEEREKKGFVIGEISKNSSGWDCNFQFKETPARRFLTIEVAEMDGDIGEAILKQIKKENVQDAVIRVRYKASKSRGAEERKIKEALCGAYKVLVERIFEKPEKPTRRIELSKTMDVMEALEKYISSSNRPELKNIAEDLKNYAKELIEGLES